MDNKPPQQVPNTKVKSRSRNGCSLCKQKRLKCDETRPECLMCAKNGRKCPGYTQSFKWSTKHEKTLSGRAKGPSNLKDLVTATSATIQPPQQPLPAPVIVEDEQATTTASDSSPASQFEATSSQQDVQQDVQQDAQSGDFQNSLSPLLDTLIMPEYDYGIEDLLQDIWQDVPQQPIPAASKDTNQFLDQSICLFNSPGPGDPFSQLAWPATPSASPQQPVSFQIPRAINDRSSLLVEEWFRNVCPMWSSFDSDANLNRKLAFDCWTRSETVMNCLQSMSATCLSSQMPAMRRVAVSYLQLATNALQKELKVVREQPVKKFPTEILLALCCIGTAACWIDTAEIGTKFLREAKTVLKRLNQSKDLSAQDRQILSFFNNSIIYWNMLVAVVSDERDDLGIPKLKEPQRKDVAQKIVPHPWTGVSATAQRLFTQAVRLCRRFRWNLRQGSIATMQNLEIAMKDIREAQKVEEELLGLEHYQPHEISETGDRMSPVSDFINVAEGYRLASLVQLYQTFPDLVSRRLPEDAVGSHVPWDNWIVPLTLRLVNTLKTVPVTSGTRCIQPLLYLSASTGLRFDAETLLQQRRFAQAAAVAPDNAFATLGEPQVTRLSIEVTHARRFVMERLSALEHSLPPAPVLVAKDLVTAVWAGYDNDTPGLNNTHWIDVMEDSDLRTIFG